jgi:hypothetical protein
MHSVMLCLRDRILSGDATSENVRKRADLNRMGDGSTGNTGTVGPSAPLQGQVAAGASALTLLAGRAVATSGREAGAGPTCTRWRSPGPP